MRNLKKKAVIFAAVGSSILLLSVFSILYLIPSSAPESFYVGVTYCGESAEEAKQLIDEVKDYTNLFVLQSGLWQHHPDNLTAIGDYAVSSGMHFMGYFGMDSSELMKNWSDTYDGHWGNKFLGIYAGDEHGGRMLDGSMVFGKVTEDSINKGPGVLNLTAGFSIVKGPGMVGLLINDGVSVNYYADGSIRVNEVDGSTLIYEPNGEIRRVLPPGNGTVPNFVEVTVDPSEVTSYEDLLNSHPLLTHEATTNCFVEELGSELEYPHENSITTFTSDYALYWFEYLAGYDVVLAQIGWNNTIEQEIALVRGAANMHNKKWGTIITWKYNHAPYLDSGEAIYDQMRMSYEAGADYVVVFNYAKDMEGPYGTLQEEHFVALERFWNEVVQSSEVKQGSIEAEAVLVLPEYYGWGMRDLNDKIWGLWGPDEKSPQIWAISRTLLEQYGLCLDIVYEDSQLSVEGKYSKIFYWNQTL